MELNFINGTPAYLVHGTGTVKIEIFTCKHSLSYMVHTQASLIILLYDISTIILCAVLQKLAMSRLEDWKFLTRIQIIQSVSNNYGATVFEID